MNDKIRNGLASQGLEILKICVLSVLYEQTDVVPENRHQYAQGRTLERSEIFNRLDLPYLSHTLTNKSCYTLIEGVLMQLERQRPVHPVLGQGWAITEEGVSVIENLE